jgi:ADP-ribosylglycohydrolase
VNNREALDLLLAKNVVEVRRGRLFDESPPSPGPAYSWDKVEGMMLGLAVGDALGVTSEAKLPADRRRRFGEIRDYLPNRHVRLAPGERAQGYPSDDTQLAFWTLEQMLADGGMVADRVAWRFTRDHIFGIGSAVKDFLRDLKSGKAWFLCGQPSAGNGALMRIAPVLLPHLRSPSPALWADTALCAFITHNDSASIASCLAFVRML